MRVYQEIHIQIIFIFNAFHHILKFLNITLSLKTTIIFKIRINEFHTWVINMIILSFFFLPQCDEDI